MNKTIKRKRLEEDGLYVEPKEHWEMWETTVYSYEYPHQYKTKRGWRKSQSTYTNIRIPTDLIRHLGLKHKDKVVVAIRKRNPKDE
jgi:hypothetical protein